MTKMKETARIESHRQASECSSRATTFHASGGPHPYRGGSGAALAIVTGHIGTRADICVPPPPHLNSVHFQAIKTVFYNRNKRSNRLKLKKQTWRFK